MKKNGLRQLILCAVFGVSGCDWNAPAPPFQGQPCADLEDVDEEGVFLCEDGEHGGIVFVDTDADEDGDGSLTSPVSSMTAALARMDADPSLRVVMLQGDRALEATSITRPVTLLAGYGEGFVEDSTQRVRIEGEDDGVKLAGQSEDVLWRGLDIAVSASGSRAVRALSLSNITLELRDVSITLADAPSGTAGEGGGPGAEGDVGETAGTPVRVSAGAGGENLAEARAHGGEGGRGGSPSEAARAGQASAGGAPGGGIGLSGEHGTDGERGDDGAAATRGVWSFDEYSAGTPATAGMPGYPGQGGGGGGGGASMGGEGGGGGGGGAGGQGGRAGQPGTSGLPVLGIWAEESQVVLSGVTISLGRAGDGGAGGVGGAGAPGARGGASILGVNGGQSGGKGGDGGAGGVGGDGGHGLAGSSVGVWCMQSTLARDEATTVELPEAATSPLGEVTPLEVVDCPAP